MNELGKPKQYVPVFVSSTYEDLKKYRTAVQESLIRLETIVRGMEYFGSKPGSPLEECIKAVRSCNVYIGIFAMRYGSIDENTGKSMTHLEYEEAQKLGLPTLIYIIDEENQPLLPKHVDTGEKALKLSELKAELMKRFTVSFFTTPEDLSRRISQDLPEVLSVMGVNVKKEEEKEELVNINELYERFLIRPKKYSGQDIILQGIVTNDLRAVYEDEINALNLMHGDAISRSIEFADLKRNIRVIAEGEMADWLEGAKNGVKKKMKLRLMFGTYIRVDWTDNGPIDCIDSEKGVRLIELLD